jgi:hypothetical protein
MYYCMDVKTKYDKKSAFMIRIKKCNPLCIKTFDK